MKGVACRIPGKQFPVAKPPALIGREPDRMVVKRRLRTRDGQFQHQRAFARGLLFQGEPLLQTLCRILVPLKDPVAPDFDPRPCVIDSVAIDIARRRDARAEGGRVEIARTGLFRSSSCLLGEVMG